MRKAVSVLFALLVLGSGLWGANWAFEEVQHRRLAEDRKIQAGDRAEFQKQTRACPPPASTDVFIVFGQSNAANHAAIQMRAPERSFDFFRGACFTGHDPQASATGKGGSIWPSFAAEWLIGKERALLIANVARGNSKIAEWGSDTPFDRSLHVEAIALQQAGYSISGFLFMQGESDRQMPGVEYAVALQARATDLKALAPNAAFIVADSSICREGGSIAPQLSTARAQVAGQNPHMFVGLNTDQFGFEYRYDECHFNAAGQQAVGRALAQSVGQILAAKF